MVLINALFNFAPFYQPAITAKLNKYPCISITNSNINILVHDPNYLSFRLFVLAQIDIESQNCTEITVQTEAAGKTYLTFDCSNSTYLDNSSCPFNKYAYNNYYVALSVQVLSCSTHAENYGLIHACTWKYAV